MKHPAMHTVPPRFVPRLERPVLAEAKMRSLSALGGPEDPAFLTDIVAGYERTVAESIEGLRADRRPESARRWAHHLLGASRNVGALLVAEACEALHESPDDIDSQLDALDLVAQRTAAALRQRLLGRIE